MEKKAHKGRILISGGSGMIGRHLSAMLAAEGYNVTWLSRRNRSEGSDYAVIEWDVKKSKLDTADLEGFDAVVHLAGAGVADKRWSAARKREILESRTASGALLADRLSRVKQKPGVFISASGVGYYGLDTGDKMVDEASPPGEDFLAEVVKQWEAASASIESLGIRRMVVRIGVVLSDEGGALPELSAPIKLGFGAPLGSGNQWMSWIHIDDLCRLLVEAIENKAYAGIINAVGPAPATNRELTRAVAKVLEKPLWLPPVPGFVLRLLVGEMAGVVLGGNRVSAGKLQGLGFRHKFSSLTEAIKDLLL